MVFLMVKIAAYIVVSVLFGFLIGLLYSNTKNREKFLKKEHKYNKIINDKNSMIMKLKSELRSTLRKVEAINQGYELQSKLLETKDRELQERSIDELSQLKEDHRALSLELSKKIKIIDEKDEIISLLEKKVNQISKEIV